MAAPLTGYGSLIALAGVVLGWTGSAHSARADPLVCSWGSFDDSAPVGPVFELNGNRSPLPPTYQSSCSTTRKDIDEEDEVVVSEGDRALVLELLAGSVMALSPWVGSYGMPHPPILKPPVKPRRPRPQGPPKGHPPPRHAPEPASLVTGLLGSGLLGLMAWRKRKKKPESEDEFDATADGT